MEQPLQRTIMISYSTLFGVRYVLHLHDYDYADYYRSRGTFLKRLIVLGDLTNGAAAACDVDMRHTGRRKTRVK
jgi:hypothetical protein